MKPIFYASTLERMASRNEERKQKVIELVDSFLQRTPEQFKEALATLKQGDITKASQQLHKMRGGIGNLGGLRLADNMLNLETQLTDMSEEQSVTELEKLEQELNELLNEVQQWKNTLT